MELPLAEKRRRTTGLVLVVLGIFAGAASLFALFVILPVAVGQAEMLLYMAMGAVLAFPAGAVYLTVPRLLDRYDPEPWYALFGSLLWGGVGACGFAALINSAASEMVSSVAGAQAGDVFGSVVSAPIVEEGLKAVGVYGIFYFLRREFDGVVDGIIYATFVAFGFATVENVVYYARAAGSDALGLTFFMRGVLFPWGHPVYTSMFGLGLGIARESERMWMKFLAPTAGYVMAVLLHAAWNGSAVIASQAGEGGALLFFCMLPVWFLFVAAFLILVIILVRRRGKIIRKFLEDEVALGNLTSEEVALVVSAFGVLRARMRWGSKGALFARAVARLALSKWHALRAERTSTRTISADFIVPLRQDIAALKREIAAR